MRYANVYATTRNTGSDTCDCGIVYSARGLELLTLASHCVKPDSLKVRLPASLPHLLIAMKSAVSFPTDLILADHPDWKTQASEMTFSIRV